VPEPTWQPPKGKDRGRRLNVYLPGDLAERMAKVESTAGAKGIRPNWSQVCQRAIAVALDALEALLHP
jgi:hypothetical protein